MHIRTFKVGNLLDASEMRAKEFNLDEEKKITKEEEQQDESVKGAYMEKN